MKPAGSDLTPDVRIDSCRSSRETTNAGTERRRHRLRKAIIFFFLFLLLSAAAAAGFYRYAGQIIALACGSPQKADAVVVLGGDPDGRSVTGADLVRKGYAPAALIINGRHGSKAERLFRQVVSGSENIHLDLRPRNSYEEAVAGLEAMKRYGWRRVLVVSDPPHMLRVWWVWNHVLSGTGFKAVPVARTDWQWHPDRWRDDRETREYVIKEYKKLGYYLLVYGLGIPSVWLDHFRT